MSLVPDESPDGNERADAAASRKIALARVRSPAGDWPAHDPARSTIILMAASVSTIRREAFMSAEQPRDQLEIAGIDLEQGPFPGAFGAVHGIHVPDLRDDDADHRARPKTMAVVLACKPLADSLVGNDLQRIGRDE